MPASCPPHWPVLPSARAASDAHHRCFQHLLQEVNILVNATTCSRLAWFSQGRAAAAWLHCWLCAVACLLPGCCMPRVSQHALLVSKCNWCQLPEGWPGEVGCKRAPCMSCAEGAAHSSSGVYTDLCVTQQCTSHNQCWRDAACNRGQCQGGGRNHQQVQGLGWSSMILLPSFLEHNRPACMLAPAPSPAHAAVPQPVSHARDQQQGVLAPFS